MKLYYIILFFLAAQFSWAFNQASSEALADLMEKCLSSEQDAVFFNEACESIKKYIEDGADPDSSTTDNFRAIHFAALNGRADLIQQLAQAHAEIDPYTLSKKWTPLHIAAHNDKADAMELLLLLGSNPNAKKSSLEPINEVAERETRAVHPTRLPRSRSLGHDTTHAYSTRLPRSKSLDSRPLIGKIFKFNNGENNYNLKRKIMLVWIANHKEEHNQAFEKYKNMQSIMKINNIIFIFPPEMVRSIMQFYIMMLYPLANR